MALIRRDTALSIANVMKVAISPRILAQLARSPTLNTQAYDAFTLGRHLHERAGLTDFERAKAAYEETITLAALLRTRIWRTGSPAR